MKNNSDISEQIRSPEAPAPTPSLSPVTVIVNAIPAAPVETIVPDRPVTPPTDLVGSNVRRIFYGAGIIIGLREAFEVVSESVAEDAPFLETIRIHLVRAVTFISLSVLGLIGARYFGWRNGLRRAEQDTEENNMRRQRRAAERQNIQQNDIETGQQNVHTEAEPPNIGVTTIPLDIVPESATTTPRTIITPSLNSPLQSPKSLSNSV